MASLGPSRAVAGMFMSGSTALLVVAVLGGLSALQPPVDLAGVRVPPLAHPVLETRQQHDGDRLRDAGATAPTTILASTGMNGDRAGIGLVTISTGSA